MINLKLSAKLNLVVWFVITVPGIAFGWFLTLHNESRVKSIFEKRGTAFTVNLAYNSEFGLLSRNKKELVRLVAGLLQEEDVAAAAILDKTGTVVAKLVDGVQNDFLFFQPEKLFSQNDTDLMIKVKKNHYQGKPYLFITAPVFTAEQKISIDEDIFFPDKENLSREAIGRAVVCLTMTDLINDLSNNRNLMGIFFILILIMVSVMIVLATKGLVITPLNRVLAGTEIIGGGNFDFRLDSKKKDEIGILASGFNKMAEDLKKFTKDLTLEKEFSSRVIESQTDMLCVVDNQGIITRTNKALLDLLGYSADELTGKNVIIIFGDNKDDEDAVKKTLGNALKGENLQEWETLLFTKEKEKIMVSFGAGPIKDETGMIIGAIGVARDMRERIKLKNQIRQYTENLEKMVEARTRELQAKDVQLIQSSKLASLGEMAAGIAHEINQPLNVIKMTTTGILHSLKKGKNISDKMAKEELLITNAQIERIRKIINHLRTFSRKSDEIETEEINMNIPLQNSLTFVGEQLKLHQIKVKFELDESLPKVMADANKLEQVFLNIITNARDAMDERERDFTGGEADYEKLLKIKSFADKGRAVVTISDTGRGISDNAMEKIFEPFFTTKEVGKGTGLGMSISYSIIKDFKGSISFEGKDGGGTTFRVELPC